VPLTDVSRPPYIWRGGPCPPKLPELSNARIRKRSVTPNTAFMTENPQFLALDSHQPPHSASIMTAISKKLNRKELFKHPYTIQCALPKDHRTSYTYTSSSLSTLSILYLSWSRKQAGIIAIRAERNSENGPADEMPPVLTHKLVKLRTGEFGINGWHNIFLHCTSHGLRMKSLKLNGIIENFMKNINKTVYINPSSRNVIIKQHSRQIGRISIASTPHYENSVGGWRQFSPILRLWNHTCQYWDGKRMNIGYL
jgi:hypothetical protein